MAKDRSQERIDRFTYTDEDDIQVYNLEDLTIAEEPKKAIAASAILDFTIKTDLEE